MHNNLPIFLKMHQNRLLHVPKNVNMSSLVRADIKPIKVANVKCHIGEIQEIAHIFMPAQSHHVSILKKCIGLCFYYLMCSRGSLLQSVKPTYVCKKHDTIFMTLIKHIFKFHVNSAKTAVFHLNFSNSLTFHWLLIRLTHKLLSGLWQQTSRQSIFIKPIKHFKSAYIFE